VSVSAEDVFELLTAIEAAGLEVWVDGGWGVDALLGEQTREHQDLDLVARLEDIEPMLRALAPWHFSVAEDHRPVRCVLRDRRGRQIDVHTVTLDATG
jgi:lincosamide nucleotidyltransferase A/C/D/E